MNQRVTSSAHTHTHILRESVKQDQHLCCWPLFPFLSGAWTPASLRKRWEVRCQWHVSTIFRPSYHIVADLPVYSHDVPIFHGYPPVN